MDFGGSKNAGIATGLIDAFVYLGSELQGFILGRVLPDVTRDGAEYTADPNNWKWWAGLPRAIHYHRFAALPPYLECYRQKREKRKHSMTLLGTVQPVAVATFV